MACWLCVVHIYSRQQQEHEAALDRALAAAQRDLDEQVGFGAPHDTTASHSDTMLLFPFSAGNQAT